MRRGMSKRLNYLRKRGDSTIGVIGETRRRRGDKPRADEQSKYQTISAFQVQNLRLSLRISLLSLFKHGSLVLLYDTTSSIFLQFSQTHFQVSDLKTIQTLLLCFQREEKRGRFLEGTISFLQVKIDGVENIKGHELIIHGGGLQVLFDYLYLLVLLDCKVDILVIKEIRAGCVDVHDQQIAQLQQAVHEIKVSLTLLNEERSESREFRKVVLAWMKSQEEKSVDSSGMELQSELLQRFGSFELHTTSEQSDLIQLLELISDSFGDADDTGRPNCVASKVSPSRFCYSNASGPLTASSVGSRGAQKC
ncbi:hypothetical protein R6Q59_035048 [Mikania micrantha]